MEQLNHYNSTFEEQKNRITVVCDAVYLQQNIGSVFRICDAFGVEKIIFTGEHFILSERKVNKTSRSTQKIVPFEIIKDIDVVLQHFQKEKQQIIALEITNTSISLDKLILKNKPIVIIIGSEINGVSQKFLKAANYAVHIPMFGKNSSMNVANSLAISLYEVSKQLSL